MWTKVMLAFIALINIFAIYLIVSSVEDASRGGFVLTKPPIQVSFRGAYTDLNMQHLERLVAEVSKVPFEDYTFRENHNIRLNSIDGKSDAVNVQLIESTTSVKEKSDD
jgi:hypothetical protein